MRLAKDDHLIQTLAAQCADQTFSIAILPTARLVATASLRGQKIDARGTIIWNLTSTLEGGSSSLYETSDGAFFLVRKIKEGCYAEPDFIGRLPYLNDPGLYPLTRKQALAWAESKKFDTDKIEAMFGKIDEVGKKTAGSMPLRIPKTLKASIDAAAEDAEQSANAWAMRCLERCANMDGIGEKLGEIWQTARSGHRERRGRLLERDAARDALTH